MPSYIALLYLQVLLTSLSINTAAVHETAQILEEPQTQSIVIGRFAIFHCATINTREAVWIINETTVLQYPYDWNPPSQDMQLDEPKTSTNPSTYNLTMTVNGTLTTNGTKVGCRAYGTTTGHPPANSNTAILYVYFPPPPPDVILDFPDYTSSILIHLQPLSIWLDYHSSYYQFTVINETDSYTSLLYSGVISANTSVLNVTESILPHTTCSLYTLSVSIASVSPTLGIGQAYNFSVISSNPVLPSFDSIHWPAINNTVYFSSNNTPVLVLLQAQVSNTCAFVDYNYTICIEERQENQLVLEIGPKGLATSGHIREMIVDYPFDGVEYLFWIQIQSMHSITKRRNEVQSEKHVFSTGSRINPTEPGTTAVLTTGNPFQVAVIILGVISGILLFLVITLMACFIYTCKRSKQKTGRNTSASSAMITNPIYDGPVYETVRQQYSPLDSSPSSTPDDSPTAPLQENSRYTINPTSRNDIVEKVRRNTLPVSPNQNVNRTISPLAGTSFRSSSLSGNTTYKHPRRERNKLHLTLPLSNQGLTSNQDDGDSGSGGGSRSLPRGSVMTDDENYTVMSPAGSRAFGSSFNGGWGDFGPELTSK